ncbi:gliding motility-associated C-terminal domain-containing protein [Belliella sp. DSM 107340]|uniref:Gliding motility-associated C-terminal domain-containing protein n=1 Tax=Belliella calami TaxID=2923436 RepID=A0ABS9UI97_9BACT|nr:gliding motility-associated C-terminal domain-containing protein [Belliella calami]MCH7396344.1 gliding motility-associated C-terminal domain-containing protein [Belliella calami]
MKTRISSLLKRITLVFLFVFNVFAFQSFSQTVNQGEMAILPGTTVSTLFNLDNRQSGRLINDGDLYLFANLNNDGEITFSNGTEGVSRFVGQNTVQQIMGTKISNLNNVVFDNASAPNAFHLFGDLSVAGISNFIEGIVLADGFGGLMIFEKGSEHQSTSDRSHVDGTVAKVGNESFNYPIGDSGFFRFAGISAPANESERFRAKYFLEDPNNFYPRDQKAPRLNLINDAEYWELVKENGQSDVKLTLSWRDVTTPAFILGQTNSVVVAKWDNSDNQWISLGGDVDLASQTVTTPLVLDSYGIFTLAVLSSNLVNMAIEKTSFDVSIWEGDVFEYEIRVQNNSEFEATEVVIVDNLPNGVSYVSNEVETAFGLMEYSLNVIGQTLTWSVPVFLAGDEMIIRLKVRAETPGTIINFAEVLALEQDQDLNDNTDTDENRILEFFIPNVITPNGDGDNDTFQIMGLSKFASNKIVIFNRYGDHLFESENYQNDWDADGLPAGTFFYILTVNEHNGQEKQFKGWIQVVKE